MYNEYSETQLAGSTNKIKIGLCSGVQIVYESSPSEAGGLCVQVEDTSST